MWPPLKNLLRSFGLFSFGIILIMGSGCVENDGVLQMPLLQNSWTHSFEENPSGDIALYRPSDYMEFPISRYRQVFVFAENNICDYRQLAANDGHYFERGTWSYNQKTNILKIFNPNAVMIYEFEVVELTNNSLKLRTMK